ncbi:DUF2914 domain-containing protein [Candidatus Kaiserbacteria bacterium]|nr:DUF2914 domain-containing protein [Candidatus Kaiserbacteria bacterium]
MDFIERLSARYPSLRRLPLHHVQKHWLTISFFFGVIVDNLTLSRVDKVLDNVALASYVILAMASLLIMYAATAGKLPQKILENYQQFVREWSEVALQFVFGNLLSGLLVFYSRSGSWWASWPFLLVILGVMVGNERLTRRGERLLLNLAMLFVGLFSYVALIVPVVMGKMGAWIFVLSGVIALVVMYGFVRLLALVVPNFMRANMRMVAFTLMLAYVVLNFLYFTNIIPPIPLSLKELGAYHNVEKLENGSYALTYEKGKWYELWKNSDTTFHYQTGDMLYCFASVFAPTRLSVEIFHRWEYYVPEDHEWRTHSRLSYGIEGGRGEGYRGYSWVRHPTPGTWRCTVETDRKQVLGSETFEVVEGQVPIGLVTELR